ncbi:MAG: AraC family transcriptional regulator [Cyanobacteria bacterium P01_F01_bin.150]
MSVKVRKRSKPILIRRSGDARNVSEGAIETMAQQASQFSSEISCLQDIVEFKGWLVDGAIRLEDWTVEHTVQSSDELQMSGLSRHALLFSTGRINSRRQMSRFAGQEYNGPGYSEQFFLLPAGIPSEAAWDGDDEAITIDIEPESLRQMALQTDCINPDRVELKPFVFAEDDQITRFAYSLLYEIRTGGAGSRLYSESLLTAFNVHLLRHYCTINAKFKTYKDGLAPYMRREVLDYIEANLANGDLSLLALAQLTGLNPHYFSRQFKKSTGYPPHQYVIVRRVEKAKRLLKQRQLPISQIAVECGFSSQSHFYGAFRRLVSTTPKRYRGML